MTPPVEYNDKVAGVAVSVLVDLSLACLTEQVAFDWLCPVGSGNFLGFCNMILRGELKRGHGRWVAGAWLTEDLAISGRM